MIAQDLHPKHYNFKENSIYCNAMWSFDLQNYLCRGSSAAGRCDHSRWSSTFSRLNTLHLPHSSPRRLLRNRWPSRGQDSHLVSLPLLTLGTHSSSDTRSASWERAAEEWGRDEEEEKENIRQIPF